MTDKEQAEAMGLNYRTWRSHKYIPAEEHLAKALKAAEKALISEPTNKKAQAIQAILTD